MVKIDIIRETFQELIKIFGLDEHIVYGIKERPIRNISTFFGNTEHYNCTSSHPRFGFASNIWLEDMRKKLI